MEKVYNVIMVAGGLIGFLLMIGLGIGSLKAMPDNAQVYVDDSTKIYIAPTCIKTATGFRRITAGEARALGYKSDSRCRNEGAFIQDGRSLTGMFLQKIGVLKPLPSRWNEDGSWNY